MMLALNFSIVERLIKRLQTLVSNTPKYNYTVEANRTIILGTILAYFTNLCKSI